MSCNYAAYTVVGCLLPDDFMEKIYQKKEVFVQSHQCDGNNITTYPGDMEIPRFCPDCGKKLQKIRLECTDKSYEDSDGEKIGDLKIVTDGMNGNKWACAFVQKFNDDGSGGGKIYDGKNGTLDLAANCREIKAALEPLDLWNPATFGLWTILYISC